jgi:hypothetical protein
MAGRPRRYTVADRKRMRELYGRCKNAAEVAREMGCSPAVVRCEVSPEYLERRRSQNRLAQRANYIHTDSHKEREVYDRDYKPLYDPKRDGGPTYDHPTAEFFGDPPVGRREMISGHKPRSMPSLPAKFNRGDWA